MSLCGQVCMQPSSYIWAYFCAFYVIKHTHPEVFFFFVCFLAVTAKLCEIQKGHWTSCCPFLCHITGIILLYRRKQSLRKTEHCTGALSLCTHARFCMRAGKITESAYTDVWHVQGLFWIELFRCAFPLSSNPVVHVNVKLVSLCPADLYMFTLLLYITINQSCKLISE